jgi:hypothetical protein
LSGTRAIVMSSRVSSSPFVIGLAAAGLLIASLLVDGGCAGRGRGTRGPEVGAPSKGGATEEPAGAKAAGRETTSEREPGEAVRSEEITLPGQNRTLPSQDPRNQEGTGELPRIGDASGISPAQASPGATEGAGTPAPQPGQIERAEAPPLPPSFLPPPVPSGESRFRVQVLASALAANAYRVRSELEENVGMPAYVEQEQGIWKVRAGDMRERAEADVLRRRLFGLGYEDAFVVECRGR